MRTIMAFVLIAVLFTLPTLAQVQQQSARTYDPQRLAEQIAPFIDEQTFAVLHVDVTRIDMTATAELAAKLAEASGDHDFEGLAVGIKMVGGLAEQFIKAGGRDLYLVSSIADMPGNGFFLVVPLGDGADAEALQALMLTGNAAGQLPPSDSRREQIKTIHNALWYGGSRQWQRIETLKPDARPELVSAFKAAGDSAAQALLLPPHYTQRVIEEMMPTLPPQVGGGPSTALTRGVQWASLGVNTPPEMSIRLIVQSQDAPAASEFHKFLQRALAEAMKAADVRKLLPDLDDKAIAAIMPTVKGDRLEFALDGKQVESFLKDTVLPGLTKAKYQAKLAIAARNLKSLGTAILAYAADHKGAWPDSLAQLAEEGIISVARLISTLDYSASPGYVYIMPRQGQNKLERPDRRMIAYDAGGTVETGIPVLFADGHVETITDKETFDKLLDEAKSGDQR